MGLGGLELCLEGRFQGRQSGCIVARYVNSKEEGGRLALILQGARRSNEILPALILHSQLWTCRSLHWHCPQPPQKAQLPCS